LALSEIDRDLLHRCLEHKPNSWEDFVDRFLGLVVHVVNHSAQARSIRLTAEDREDLCADVLLTILNEDYAVLRHFRGESSLATYLTVIARRVVVRRLLKLDHSTSLADPATVPSEAGLDTGAEKRINDRDEVQRLLSGLDDREAQVVRMYHLEGHTYEEISSRVGMPAGTIGPTLSRARAKMRRTHESTS
jgi:RNA polymerase sigma-70 factor (ECF subfamily)